MDPWLIAALIGLAGTIVAALITAFGSALAERLKNPRGPADQLDLLEGSIDAPKPGSHLERTFHCRGRVRGYRRGANLWLVVEKGGRFWPKEGRILPNTKTGKWEATVFEDGVLERTNPKYPGHPGVR